MLLQFTEPTTETYRNSLKILGVEYNSYIPENAWLVKFSGNKGKLISKEKVRYLAPYRPEFKISPDLESTSSSGDSIRIRVEFFQSSNSPGEEIEKFGNVTGKFGDNIWRMETSEQNLTKIAELKHVKRIYPRTPDQATFNAQSRDLIEVNQLQKSPYNLRGSGFTGAVWDSGWAGKHEDLNYTGKRIVGDKGEDCGDCQVKEHGTHVAGTMLGGGVLDNTLRGMAPDARLTTYEWPNSAGTYSFLNEIEVETDESINSYSSILSQNSWGFTGESNYGSYDSVANTYDSIISNDNANVNGDLNIIFSAGNNQNKQSYDYNTTSPPSTAKNVITVGAVDDTAGMTSYSSWGPTDDGRIKPTVVADGGNCYSIKSTIPGNSYGEKCGTSMAAPAVSGAVILINQKFNRTYGRIPEPATVKSLLIQTAEDLGNTGPDFKFGWGLVNATAAVEYVEASDGKKLIKRDSVGQGGSDSYKVKVPKGENVKFTLVWSDYPASSSASKALVNDLDLIVKNGAGERKYPYTLSWENKTQAALQSQEDHTNPLEQVEISSTGTQEYSVKVKGYNVPEGPQDYTLLMTSEKSEPVAPNLTVESPSNTTYSSVPDFNLSSNQSLDDAKYSIDGIQNFSMIRENDTYFYNTSAAISDGRHEAVFYGKNSFGNWSSENVYFTLDTQKPAVDPKKPSNNSNISDTFSVNLTYSDSLSGVKDVNISLLNSSGLILSFSGNKTLDSRNYADGAYDIRFRVSDSAGNTREKIIDVILDNAAPEIGIENPKNSETLTTPFNVSAAITDLTGVMRKEFEITNTSGIQASGNFNATGVGSDLLNGDYNASFEAEDYAGNIVNRTVVFSVSEEVNLTVETPENRTYAEIPDFNLSSNVSMSDAKYSIDGLRNYSMVKETGKFFYNTSAVVSNGSHRSTFWANDSTGNWFSETVNFTVDTEKPSLTPELPQKDANISGSFDVEAKWSDSYTEVIEHSYTIENSTYSENGVLNSTENSTTFADGLYTIYYNITDSAGNRKTRSRTVNIDNTDPELSIQKPLNNSKISGSLEVNATWNDLGAGISDVNISLKNSSGILESFSSNKTLDSTNYSDGKYSISFQVTDSAGNTEIKQLEVNIDNSAPKMNITSPKSREIVSEPFNVSAELRDDSGITRREFEISNSSGVQISGNFNETVAGLEDGKYNASLEAEDEAGNTVNRTVEFSVTTPVNLTIESPLSINYSEVPDFNLSSNDSLSTARYSIDGLRNYSMVKKNSEFFYNTSAVTDNGTHTAVFWANDTSGKWFSEEVSFTVDTEKPSLTPEKPSDGENISGMFDISAKWSDGFTGIDEHSYTVFNGTVVKSGVLNDTLNSSNFADGDYRVYFNVTDSAGNTRAKSRNITLDNTAPGLSLDSPENNSNISGSFDISGSWQDLETSVSNVTISLQNSSGVQSTFSGNKTLDSTTYSDGNYNISFRVEDSAGNTREKILSVDFDNTNPDLQVTTPTDNSVVSRPFDVEVAFSDLGGVERASFNLSNQTGVIVSESLNGTVNSTEASEGDYNISYVVRDFAGNTITREINVSVSNPPELTVKSPVNRTYTRIPDFNLSSNEKISNAVVDIGNKNYSLQGKNDTYYYNSSLHLSDGRYDAVFHANNTENLFSNRSVSFTIDTTPPVAEVIGFSDNANISTDFEVNATVEDPISGVRNSTFHIFNSSGSQTPLKELNATQDISGLADGRYNLSFNFTDNAGNYNDSLNLSITIDRESPVLQVDSPVENVLSGSFDVNFSTYDLLTDIRNSSFTLMNSSDSSITSGSTNTSIDSTKYADGDYTLRYTARDHANNTETSTFGLTFDNTAPDLNLVSPADENLSGTLDVEAAFNDSTSLVRKRYRWMKDGSNVTSWTTLNDTDFDSQNLQDGSYMINVEAEDDAGNTASESFDFTVDNTAPGANLTRYGFENLSGKWAASGFTLESTCSDSTTGLKTHQYEFNGSTNTTSENSVNISFEGSGLKSASFTCMDYSGNQNSTSMVKWLDSGAPRIESTLPLNGSSSVSRSFELSATLHDEASESGINTSASNMSTVEGSINNVNWSNDSFTADISGLDYSTTFTITGNITDYAGQTHEVHLEYTTKSNPDSDGGSGGGGGGGGGGGSLPSGGSTPSKNKEDEKTRVKKNPGTVTVKNLEVQGESGDVNLAEAGTAIRSLQVSGNGEIDFEISRLEQKIEEPENTVSYSSVEMNLNKSGDISTNVTFILPRKWIEKNNLRAEKTSLYRKNGPEWEKLDTKMIDASKKGFMYQAEVPHFSKFTVAVEKESCVKKNYSVIKDGTCRQVSSCQKPEGDVVDSCRNVGGLNTTLQGKTGDENTTNSSKSIKIPDVPDIKIEDYISLIVGFLILIMLTGVSYLAYNLYEKKQLQETVEELREAASGDPELVYIIKDIEAAIEKGDYGEAGERMGDLKEALAQKK